MAVCSHCGKKIENGHIVAFDQSTGRVFHTNFHDVDHDGTLLLVGLRSLAETGFIPDSLMHLREAIEHHLKLNHQLEQGKGAGPLKNIDKLEKISRDWASSYGVQIASCHDRMADRTGEATMCRKGMWVNGYLLNLPNSELVRNASTFRYAAFTFTPPGNSRIWGFGAAIKIDPAYFSKAFTPEKMGSYVARGVALKIE